MQQEYTAQVQPSTDQFLRWSQATENPNYANPYNINSFSANVASGPQFQQAVPAPSTQLARRPINRQVVPARTAFESANDPWGPFGDDGLLDGQNSTGMEETDSIELLEEKALIAKRDAQSKRKQIPPFVQKLSR
jgi:heat shock transcription factor, other eukaryote